MITYSFSVALASVLIEGETKSKHAAFTAAREVIEAAESDGIEVVGWWIFAPDGTEIAGVDELGLAKHRRRLREQAEADFRRHFYGAA